MYKIMETSITQHIMLKKAMFASNTFIYNLKHGMYHVHIPKDMYLHDILVCMQ